MLQTPTNPDLKFLLDCAMQTRPLAQDLTRTELAQGEHIDFASRKGAAVVRFVVGGLQPELIVISRQFGENHPLVGAVHPASRTVLNAPGHMVEQDGRVALGEVAEADKRIVSARFEQQGQKIGPDDIPRFLELLGTDPTRGN